MTVDPATTPHRAEHAGARYFFCSAKCRDRFAADPAAFVATDRAEIKPVPRMLVGETLWT